uniref:Uncharacterized protein n=1 Tax=Panagrolaimus sp. ES5 TaxID=591445 RepID=A0AC34GQE6_9BILA
MIAEYKKIVPRDRIVVYDIGLTQNQSHILLNICNVVVEKFNFDDFPKYVKILTHYRWKPIVITKALQKYGSIIYVDSSVHFRNTNYLRIPSLVNCRSNNDDVKCTHFPYMLHSYTGHSIHYATMTNVYQYIPTIKEAMKKTKMYEAGLAYVTPTKETFEILKW